MEVPFSKSQPSTKGRLSIIFARLSHGKREGKVSPSDWQLPHLTLKNSCSGTLVSNYTPLTAFFPGVFRSYAHP